MNLFSFVFGKIKVLEWPLSRQWDFSQHGYKFDTYEGWTFPSMSLDAKHDMWTYLVFYSVKWKYWINPGRENEFSVYGYKCDKRDGWTCPFIKYDMCNYFLLNSVK